MIWIKLKDIVLKEDGYASVEMLLIIVGVATIGGLVSLKLVKTVFRPLHNISLEKMKSIRNSGY